jgi:hypothetical protein
MHLPILWTRKKERRKGGMWWTSIRSIITLAVGFTFCYLAITSRLEAKDFMIITLLVFNFYFLDKKRPTNEEVKK